MQQPSSQQTLFNASYRALTERGISTEEATQAAYIIAYIDPVRSRTTDEQQVITTTWAQLNDRTSSSSIGAKGY